MPLKTAMSKWITCVDEPHPKHGLYDVMRKSGATGVGLTFPPECAVHKFNVNEFLDSGIAIAVWPHRCAHSSPNTAGSQPAFHADFRKYLALKEEGQPARQDRSIKELPDVIFDYRSSAAAAEGFALFWDDPSRVVKLPDYRLAAPGRSESN